MMHITVIFFASSHFFWYEYHIEDVLLLLFFLRRPWVLLFFFSFSFVTRLDWKSTRSFLHLRELLYCRGLFFLLFLVRSFDRGNKVDTRSKHSSST